MRICRFSKLGRSNALPQTSHGNNARSPRVGLAFGDDLGIVIVESIKSPVLLAADDDDVNDSPDTDLCSSSPPDGGDIGNNTLESNDIDKSNGDSVRTERIGFYLLENNQKTFLIIHSDVSRFLKYNEPPEIL